MKEEIMRSESFNTLVHSIDGKPSIQFRFHGDVVNAELGTSRLYGELERHGGVRLRISDEKGLLADITVHRGFDSTVAEAVVQIGAALLWSNYTYHQALAKTLKGENTSDIIIVDEAHDTSREQLQSLIEDKS